MSYAIGIKLYTPQEAIELMPEGYYLTIEDGLIFANFGRLGNKWTTMLVNCQSAYQLWDENDSCHRYLSLLLKDAKFDGLKEFTYITGNHLTMAAKIVNTYDIDHYSDQTYIVYVRDNVIIGGYCYDKLDTVIFQPFTTSYALIEAIFSLMRRY